MLERIDWPNVALIAVLLVAFGALYQFGPAEQKTVAAMGFVGLVTTVGTALRGRVLKRDPASFKDGQP